MAFFLFPPDALFSKRKLGVVFNYTFISYVLVREGTNQGEGRFVMTTQPQECFFSHFSTALNSCLYSMIQTNILEENYAANFIVSI